MHVLARMSLKNKALIALITIVASLFGVLSVTSLKQELMPSVQFPAIAVITSYPGASPEVVNNDVSLPIEEAVRGVPSLERSSSTSSTGASMVLLEFTYGTDIIATEQRVERAISRIAQLLPSDVDPQVVSGSIDDFPVIQIAVGAPDGTNSDELAEQLELTAVPKLEEIDGVRQIQVGGASGRRVSITPDAEALAASGFTEQSIRDALQQNGVLLPGGQVTDDEYSLAVQIGGRVESVEDLASIPLIPGIGEVTTISDVATVTEEANPVSSISRINGEAAVTIAITKLAAANTVDVSHAVQEILPDIEDALGGASLTVVFDQAPYIEQSIETLAVEGMLGLLFAVLVILVFLLSLRATLVTAVSIPTSVLLTFIGLNFAEYTLNMLTLGALTISIGRVVDDSIVVIENIKRHLVEGADRGRSIITAVREVASAITASTITTIAVFLPLAFVEGMVGELFAPFAFTVSYALAASLLVSLTIVPVLAYWFLKPAPATSADETREVPEGERHRFLADGSEVTRLQRSYLPVINWTLKRPAVTLLAAVIVFAGTIASYPLMKTNFMSADEQNAVRLTQTLTPGLSLDAQLAEVERVEEALSDVATVDTVQVTIGSADPMGAMFGGGGDGTISYSLTTDADADQERVQADIRDAVSAIDEAGDFAISAGGSGGIGAPSTVDINITAPGQEALREGVNALLAQLQTRNEFSQVESNLGESRPTLAITVNRDEAAQSGMSEVMLASLVSARMQPSAIGEIVLDDASVRVYLARDDAPETLDEIRALPIPTALGTQRLDELASIDVVDGPVTITTADGVRSATVSATPADEDLTVASTAVNEVLETVSLPGGVSASVGGVLAEQEEAFAQLGLALLAAILIVYVVMVATFKSLLQPILLLVSVPFAATGAILLLIATGIPLGVASLIGVLMLIGIVVTNAIVLIDLVNQLRARGMALRDAVRTGAAHRYRPIIMTALATIFALIPMALGITGKGGFISQPLAVVVIGGLLSSTVLTLVVLPTLYYAVERRRLPKAERVNERARP